MNKKHTALPNLIFTMESKIPNIRNILDHLKGFCNQYHIASGIFEDLSVATEESVVNVIQHTYKDLMEEPNIYISFFIIENHFYIQMRDVGKLFDFDKNYKLMENLKKENPLQKIGGYGLILIKKLSDEVKYTRTEKYNLLTIKKNLDPSSSTY